MKERFWIIASLMVLSLPPTASGQNAAVFQCPGPSNTILYTNIEQSDCRPMTLGAVTVAPTRTYSPSVESPHSMLSDKFDYTAPIGSMRNRLVQGAPPQDVGEGPSQPPFGLGHGLGYPYQRFGGRLRQSPQGLGHGPGYPPQHFGSGLEHSLPGVGHRPGPPPQGFGGASERAPQRLGGGPVTGRLR